MKLPDKITVFDSPTKLARRAAEILSAKIADTLKSRHNFSLVLSGGSTPKALYTILASDAYSGQIPWEKIKIFFGDERCVPPDSDESNYKMAFDSLLSKVPMPEENVFRMKGEIAPDSAAADYASSIQAALGDKPVFDLVLLGMGSDGHTASLFPGSAALQETHNLVAANFIKKFGAYRLTLTLPALNAAEDIIFMVAGKDKAIALEAVLGNSDAAPLPARMIKPQHGGTAWLIDRDAASLLDIDAL